MGKGRYLFEKLTESADLISESLPGQPIVEIAGENRVLIENHEGIKAYGNEKIIVKVEFGFLSICGCDMEIIKMTRDQLVIRGKINAVQLLRRNQ